MSMTEQQAAALEKGNKIRSDRRKVKWGLKTGNLSLREALDHPSTASMKVGVLLQYLPGRHLPDLHKEPHPRKTPAKAEVLAKKVLRGTQIDPNKEVGTLTEGQKERIHRSARTHRPWMT